MRWWYWVLIWLIAVVLILLFMRGTTRGWDDDE